MSRKSRSTQRQPARKQSLVVTGTKLPGRRSRSQSRSRGLATARDGPPTSVGLFRPTRNLQKPTFSGSMVNPRFPSKGSRRRGAGVGGTGSLPHIVASYVDPFDEEAGGCRYPDNFQGITDTFTTTYVNSITTAPASGSGFTDANMTATASQAGTSLFLLTPDPSNIMVQGVCGTPQSGYFALRNNMFTWPNGIVFTGATGSANAFGPGTGIQNIDNSINNLTPFRTQYSAARLVSGGVKLFSTSNFSTVSGTIHLAPVFVNLSTMTSNNIGAIGGRYDPTKGEMFNGWLTALPSDLPSMANLPGYCQFPMSSLEEDQISAIFKRVGEEALLFKSLDSAWGMTDGNSASLAVRSGSANLPDSYGHYCILVFVDGVLSNAGTPAAGSTPIMEIEIRNHYECQFNPMAMMAIGTTITNGSYGADSHKAAPHQPLLMAAADNLASDVPAIRCVDAAGIEEKGFIEAVVSAWGSAATIATSVMGAVDVAGALLSALVL